MNSMADDPLRGLDPRDLIREGFTVCRSYEAIVWGAFTGHILHDPLRHPGALYSAVFTTDGRGLISGTNANVAMVWDLGPDPSAPTPAWLPDAAEKLAGMKLDSKGRLVPYPDGWRELATGWLHNDSQEAYAKLFRAILTPAGP